MKTSLLRHSSPHHAAGLSLVELMIVVAVIGILAAFAFPAVSKVSDSASATATSVNLVNFAKAFRAYEKLEKQWPPDNIVGTMPPGVGMEHYLSEAAFESETSIGGNFNWEGPEVHPYAGISIQGSSASTELVTKLDVILDDGNLSTGYFLQTPNGRYTYIIEWNNY
ncbi:MAG: prepilin-type N-terminal cleavage/methylation domain-containing protein [Verrucomicrobiota bacterium]